MHPVLFEIPTPWGSLPVYSYGVMLGLSLICAWYVVMRLGERREGLDRDVMANCFMITAVSAVVCARLLYVITNPDEFDEMGKLFALRSGGLVAYGGFLGGLLGSWAYLRFKRVPLLAWADVVAPTLGLGLTLTRVGCYLYGCDFGARLSDGAPELLRRWGTFPHWPATVEEGHGSPAFSHHVAEYGLSPTADYSLPVHPTQLYESVVGLLLFGVAMLVWQRRRFRGQVILTVTILYGVWRFLIEYVRDDPERGFYFGFSTSQLISMALVPVAILLYQQLRKRQGKEPLVVDLPAKKPDPGAPKHSADADAADDGEAPPKKRKKRKKRRKKA